MAAWVTPHFQAILDNYRTPYFEAVSEQAQLNVLKIIKEDLRMNGKTGLPKELNKAIHKWYKQNPADYGNESDQEEVDGDETGGDEEGDELRVSTWLRKWNLRKVVEQVERQAINAQIDSKPGSGTYMASYAPAVNDVIANLSENKRKKYIRLAEKWNKSTPPKGVQAKQGRKYATKTTVDYLDVMRRQYGAEALVFFTYLDPGGRVRNVALATTPWPDPKSYEAAYPKIFDRASEAFSAWAVARQLAASESDGENPSGRRVRRKKGLWPLNTGLNGRPILPSKGKSTSLADLQGILRSYFTNSYRSFLNDQKVAVPWHKLSNSTSSCIKNWKEAIVVREPSKMQKNELETLYEYLLDLQSKGGQVLEWINDIGGVTFGGKGKERARPTESDSDHGEPREEDDDEMSSSEDSGNSHGSEPGGGMKNRIKRRKKDVSQRHDPRSSRPTKRKRL